MATAQIAQHILRTITLGKMENTMQVVHFNE
jgi:hypothetical protein